MRKYLQTYSFEPWLGCLLLNGFTFFVFLMHSLTGIIVDDMMQTFSIGVEKVSLLSSLFFYTYVLMHIPVGILFDRFGVRIVVTLASVFAALGCFMFSNAESCNQVILGRLLLGSGAAFGYVGLLAGIRLYFPSNHFLFLMSLFEGIDMIGVGILGVYLASLVEALGWRSTVFLCGAFVSILAVLIFIFVRPNKEGRHDYALKHNVTFRDLFQKMGILLCDIRLWILGMYGFFMFSIVSVFASLWGIPYLMTVYDLSLRESTSILIFLYVGIAIGSPMLTYFSWYFTSREMLAGGAFVCMVSMAALLAFPGWKPFAVAIWIFVIGFTSTTYLLSFKLAKHIAPEGSESTAMALTNLITMTAPIFLQPLVAKLLNLSNSTGVHQEPIYSAHDYNRALIIIPICFAAALILGLFWKEKEQEPKKRVRSKAAT